MVSTPGLSHQNAANVSAARGQGNSRALWVVPVLLCAIYAGECAWFIRTQSLTFDEPVHVTAGLEAWREGRFARWNDHPPLQRLLCTLPLLSSKYQITVEGQPDAYRVTAVQPDPQSLTWRGRAVSVLLGILLAVLLWMAARSAFSPGAANFVLALFVFSPAVIAHFSMITTDGAGTLMIFAAALQLVRWRRDPSWRQTCLSGVALGLLLLAKFYTPPMFLIAIGWMLVVTPEKYQLHPLRWNWSKTVAAIVLALVVLWAGYFFHVSRLSIRNGELTATFPNQEPIVKKVHSPINFSIPVPAGEYLEGLRTVAFHNHRGHRSYFLGQVSEKGGWKTYYPFVMLVKWPTLVLIFIVVAGIVTILRRVRLPKNALVVASFPAVFLVFAIFSKIDIGDRHILPLYPFVLLFCGAVWQWAAERRRVFAAVILIAVAAHAADSLRYAPGYISYFNFFVKQDQGYKLLSDSNVDWGQGLLAMKKYEDEHPGRPIHLVYWGSMEPQLYGIHAIPLSPGERVTGTVVVSATALTGQFLADPKSYRWLESYPVTDKLDHALFVFEVNKDRMLELGGKP